MIQPLQASSWRGKASDNFALAHRTALLTKMYASASRILFEIVPS